MEIQRKKRISGSLLVQIAIMFAVATIVVGALVYHFQGIISDRYVRQQTEQLSSNISTEVEKSIKQYPAWEWLLTYWHKNWDKMDIEYDVLFDAGTETEKKARTLNERHPKLQLLYAKTDVIASLPAEDQKLYAEVIYTWLLTRINQLKSSQDVAYIYCVMTDDDFREQFFLFSGAAPGAKRGTTYEDAYTLGVTVEVGEELEYGMREASKFNSHLAEGDEYMDYYYFIGKTDRKNIFVGMTHDVSSIRANTKIRTLQGTVFAVAFLIFLSALCLLLLYLFALKPLKEVQSNIRLYRETKNSQKVRSNLEQIRPKNEIGRLSEDISDLTEDIDKYMKEISEISAEKERINTELSLATRIQMSMLPSIFPPFPGRSEIDLYAVMDPAREVGGDFYDYYLIDDDHLCVVIADVSGKGIPAALFMMASKIIIKNNAMMGKSPSQILTDANEAICANNPEDMFVTVWIGILDLNTGKLVAGNAGHEYPAIGKPGKGFELTRKDHDFVVGGMSGMKYREYELQLDPGDSLFVYTDGLPEATDSNEKMFGTDRMIDVLNEVEGKSPKEVLEHVLESVETFVDQAEQFDDLTMMCIEYRGR